MQRLKDRWQITSNLQLGIIFLVFAITGSAAAYLSKPVCDLLGITKDHLGVFFLPFRLLIIFPIYQLMLVFNGFIFGQFKFFWDFEKKMLRRLKLGFLLPKED